MLRTAERPASVNHTVTDDHLLDMLITHAGHRLDKANKGEWRPDKNDDGIQYKRELEAALETCRVNDRKGDHISWAKGVLENYRAREKDKNLVFKASAAAKTTQTACVGDIIKGRRSIRYFQPREIESEKINQILDAGRWAPCSANRQAWRFVVQKVGRGGSGAKGEPENFDYQPLPYGAIVVYVAMDERPYHQGYDAGWKFAAAMDSAAATQNILLMAHSLGLGACWYYGGERLSQDKLRARLGLPEYCYIYSTVQIGYPAEAPEAPGRIPLDAMVAFIGFEKREPRNKD